MKPLATTSFAPCWHVIACGMPRVSIRGDGSDESHVVKVDPDGPWESFMDLAEARLGFRPAAVYLDSGDRVQDVGDLEQDDKLCCCRVLRGAPVPAPTQAQAPASASTPAGSAGSAAVPTESNVINIKVVSQQDEIHLKVKKTTKLSKIYAAVATRKGLQPADFRLLFDGERIAPDSEKTPGEYEMEEGDVIDFFIQQEGGSK